jgi:hypothetical protein
LSDGIPKRPTRSRLPAASAMTRGRSGAGSSRARTRMPPSSICQ